MRAPERISKLALAAGLGLLLLLPLKVWAENLLTNDKLHGTFIKYGEYEKDGNIWDLKVAEGWERFELTSRRLRFFSACEWDAFPKNPGYSDNCGGDVEHKDGLDAQVWWSSKKFDTGLYQQVSGLIMGETYGFQAGILQAFETTDGNDPAAGNMNRSVGIDPYGGTDPEAESVIWSPEEINAAYGDPTTGEKFTWFWPGIGAKALSTTMTVFVRVRSVKDATTPHSNVVWADDAFMDVAPTTTLTLTAAGPSQVAASWSGTPRSGFQLHSYEAQYRKITATTWTDLQIFTVHIAPSKNISASFTVEPGDEYLVRARTWHEQIGGDKHEVPGPWTEKSITTGGVIPGSVLDNRGVAIVGATVSVSGAMTSTTSDGLGNYSLETGAGTFALTATTASGWYSLDPISVTVAITGATAPLTFTLSPPDNFVKNGGLEGTLDGWTHNLLAMPAQASLDDAAPRSGSYSLRVFGSGSLTQTGVVSDMYRPVLSFWHKVEGGDGDDSLVVKISGDNVVQGSGSQTLILPATQPLTITQAGPAWQHLSHPLAMSGTEVYSGNLTVQFMVNQVGITPALFYLDEISFGSSQGGPNKVYLPLLFRN